MRKLYVRETWQRVGIETDQAYQAWYEDESVSSDVFLEKLFSLIQLTAAVLASRCLNLPNYEDTISNIFIKFLTREVARRKRYFEMCKAGMDPEMVKQAINCKQSWIKYMRRPVTVAMRAIEGRSKIKLCEVDSAIDYGRLIMDVHKPAVAYYDPEPGEIQVYSTISHAEKVIALGRNTLCLQSTTRTNVLANFVGVLALMDKLPAIRYMFDYDPVLRAQLASYGYDVKEAISI